jgi:hypothetical protein
MNIYHLDFPLEEIFLPTNYEKILWNNKFLKLRFHLVIHPQSVDCEKNENEVTLNKKRGVDLVGWDKIRRPELLT